MPYTHFHDFSFHTHHQRPKGGRHYQAIRRRQRPWRIAFVLVVMATIGFLGYKVFLEDGPSFSWGGTESVTKPVVQERENVPNNEPELGNPASSIPSIAPAQVTKPVSPITSTLRPTPVPTPTVSRSTAGPMPSPQATLVPTQTIPRPTAKPTLTPTPVPPLVNAPPHLRYLDQKQFMLGLINAKRKASGAPPVTLGANNAAQLHAESSLAHCVSSHWGVDGLKPNHRYNLAGGYQANGENGHGLDYCVRSGDFIKPIASIQREIEDAINGWMESQGHRENMLDPVHRKVNIGIAWDRFNSVMYQQFEGDYVDYTAPPSFTGGVLSLGGKVKNGVSFSSDKDLDIQVFYEQPPHPLTAGQVARTYCYAGGLPIASLLPPSYGFPPGSSQIDTMSYKPCPDPYDVPADAPPARSSSDAHRLWQEAYDTSARRKSHVITFKWITADAWKSTGQEFGVKADLSELVEEYGNGIYTVAVWDRRRVISDLTFFRGVVPPDTYNDKSWEVAQ